MSRFVDAEHFDERVRLAVGLEGAEMTDDFKDGIQSTLMLLKTEPTADVVPYSIEGGKITIDLSGIIDKIQGCAIKVYFGSGAYMSGAYMRGGTDDN